MKKPASAPWKPDWTNIPDKSVHHLLREAKEQLQGTIELGISSDQKSAALGAVFGGGAFTLFVTSATMFAGQHGNAAFLLAPLCAGFFLVIANGLSLLAAIPDDFYVSGYEPADLFPFAEDVLWMKMVTIQDIQRRIERNRAEFAREAKLIEWAVKSFISGVAFGTLIFLAGTVANTHEPAIAMAILVLLLLLAMATLFVEAFSA